MFQNLLKKGGHLEADPQLFCKARHPETDRLVVIIRNEDIFLHVHKVSPGDAKWLLGRKALGCVFSLVPLILCLPDRLSDNK